MQVVDQRDNSLIYKVTKEYECSRREKRLIWDELNNTPMSRRVAMPLPKEEIDKAKAKAAKLTPAPQIGRKKSFSPLFLSRHTGGPGGDETAP